MPTGDDRALVECLTALAHLNRLSILRQVQQPRALREIQVADEGSGPTLARQTVRRHLDVLLATGVLKARETERAYGETTEFVVDHQRIFALAEEVRGLARLRPTVELDALTAPLAAPQTRREPGPALVLVRGLDEGTTFPLRPPHEGSRWVVGRRRGATVGLDFDPSVSLEHASLTWKDDAPVLRDLGSTNGTSHNFRRVAAETDVRLRHGDVVTVGHSSLVYWS